MTNNFADNQLLQNLQQLKANPVQFLLRRKFNIPANIAGDPQAIINHLMQTGQVSQQQVNAAYQRMGKYY